MRGDLGKFRLALPATTTRSRREMRLILPKTADRNSLACSHEFYLQKPEVCLSFDFAD